MEDIVGFLILIVTIIISIVASVKKQSGQNKTSQQPLGNTSAESSWEEGEMENSRFQVSSEKANTRENVTDVEENTEEGEEAEEYQWQDDEAPHAKKEERQSATTKTGHEETSYPLKETRKRKTRKKRKKSKIQSIKEKFDIEEGIIYSEIINRKYF